MPSLLQTPSRPYRTHSWCTNICARPQRSLMCRTMWFQKALCAGMHLAHNNYAWTDLIDEKSPEDKGAKQGIQYVLERNFGEFEFDWDRRKLIVRILGEGGTPLLSTAWNFDLLTGKTPAPETGKVDLLDYELIHESLSAHGAQPNDWICVNHRGNPSLARKLFGFVSPVVLATFITLLPLILPTLLGCIILRRRWSIPRKAKQS